MRAPLMDTTDAAAAMRVPAPRIIMVPPSSSVAMAKYAAAAAMGMPICSKDATVPAGGPFECLLDTVHNHDEAEDEAEDK